MLDKLNTEDMYLQQNFQYAVFFNCLLHRMCKTITHLKILFERYQKLFEDWKKMLEDSPKDTKTSNNNNATNLINSEENNNNTISNNNTTN